MSSAGAGVVGSSVLLCRVSLEPDSCVRRAENLFMQRGRKALLIAKFFPGLSTIAPPLAGVVGVGLDKPRLRLQRCAGARRLPGRASRELRARHRGGGTGGVCPRQALDVNAAPYTIPGALWIAAEEMDRRGHEVPRDREIVLYCA